MKSDEITEKPLSLAKERAARLKKIRNMANLTRQDICTDGLNIHTYKGWELGRYGGVTEEGCKKVMSRIAEKGVVCTLDWLFHGNGTEPYIPQKINISDKNDESVAGGDWISNEFLVFKSRFPNAIYMQVEDDSCLPFYKEDDFVAGVISHDIMEVSVGMHCIVKMQERQLIRKLIKDGQDKMILIPINPNKNEEAIYSPKIEVFAPITRWYGETTGMF